MRAGPVVVCGAFVSGAVAWGVLAEVAGGAVAAVVGAAVSVALGFADGNSACNADKLGLGTIGDGTIVGETLAAGEALGAGVGFGDGRRKITPKYAHAPQAANIAAMMSARRARSRSVERRQAHLVERRPVRENALIHEFALCVLNRCLIDAQIRIDRVPGRPLDDLDGLLRVC